MREVLSRRALSRATLERQLLLRRSDMSVLDAVEHLVGFVPYETRTRLSAAAGPIQGCVLDDGSVCAVWRLERDRDTGGATLVVSHVGKRPAAAVAAEGRRFLRFAAADATSHDVRFVAVV